MENLHKIAQPRGRGRPRTATPVRLAIIERHREGYSAEEIVELLKGQFDKVPMLRTVHKIIGEYKALTDAEKLNDALLDILHLEHAGLPFESLPILLEVNSLIVNFNRRLVGRDDMVESRTPGWSGSTLPRRLTNRFARWVWWVHNAAPTATLEDKLPLARYLSVAEEAKDILNEDIPTDWVFGDLTFNWLAEDVDEDIKDDAATIYRDSVDKGILPKAPSALDFAEVYFGVSARLLAEGGDPEALQRYEGLMNQFPGLPRHWAGQEGSDKGGTE